MIKRNVDYKERYRVYAKENKEWDRLGLDAHTQLILGLVLAFEWYLIETGEDFSYKRFKDAIINVKITHASTEK